jgi:hypothetical protein
MLTVGQTNVFSSKFPLLDGVAYVADVAFSRWREAGYFTVNGEHYFFGRPLSTFWMGPLRLEKAAEKDLPRRLVAHAERAPFWSNAWATVSYGNRVCELSRGRRVRYPGASFLSGEEIACRADGVLLGSWTIDLHFRWATAPPRDVPLAIKIFVAAFVIVLTREKNS